MKIFLLPMLLTLLAAAGCRTSVSTSQSPLPSAQKQMMPDKRVITDPVLEKIIHMVGVNNTMVSGGLLQIQIQAQNLTSSRKSFICKVEWYNEYGVLIELPVVSSFPMSLEARETGAIIITSPTPLAMDYRILLQPSAN